MTLYPTQITGADTDSRAIIIPKLLNRILARKKQSLNIIETGTVRNISDPKRYMLGDGYSTLYMACWAANVGSEHGIYSIDLNTSVAKDYLTKYGLDCYIHFMEGDSVEALERIQTWDENLFIADFIYFDSGNDPDLTIRELTAALGILDEGSIIAFDDFDLSSADQNKGKVLLPLLGELEIPFEMFNKRVCYVDLTVEILDALDKALL